MIKPDKSLAPDWDEDNINHIAEHGLSPEQVEELYYSEGPFPTLAVKQKKKRGKSAEYQTILPFFFGHFFGTLAGHFLRFVLVVKSEDQASITPP